MAEPKTMTAEESCRSLVARLEKYASDHPEAPLSQTLIDVVEMNVGLLATLDAERAARMALEKKEAASGHTHACLTTFLLSGDPDCPCAFWETRAALVAAIARAEKAEAALERVAFWFGGMPGFNEVYTRERFDADLKTARATPAPTEKARTK